jgi:hypothetical protein
VLQITGKIELDPRDPIHAAFIEKLTLSAASDLLASSKSPARETESARRTPALVAPPAAAHASWTWA